MIKKIKVDFNCGSCAVKIDNHLQKKGYDSKTNPALKITKVNIKDENELNIVKDLIKEIGYEVKS